MPLIVGLGNPGAEYDGTPHNVGFDVLGRLARRAGVTFRRSRSGKSEETALPGGDKVILLRPLAYMNLSGVTGLFGDGLAPRAARRTVRDL